MKDNPWERGLKLFHSRHYFEAHEEWEISWRDAPIEERDFYQGMVHLTVALYQAGRKNATAARSQMRKARRRLAAYFPRRHGVSLDTLVPQVEEAVQKALEACP